MDAVGVDLAEVSSGRGRRRRRREERGRTWSVHGRNQSRAVFEESESICFSSFFFARYYDILQVSFSSFVSLGGVVLCLRLKVH